MRTLLRLVKWLALSLVLLVILLLLPVGYVETFCTAEPEDQASRPR